MAVWSPPAIWEGGECWLIGGGTSLPRQFGVPEPIIQQVVEGASPELFSPYMRVIHGKHTIAVNNAYKLGPWIDVIFFGDCAWYLNHKMALAQLGCLKVTSCDRFAHRTKENSEGMKYLARDRKKTTGISEDPTTVSWNYNSGAAAISLAAHLGVVRIILLGFDMVLGDKGVSHWHGSHRPPGSRPVKRRAPTPSFERHLAGFPVIAADAKKRGIEIINASPISAITVFPKVQVSELVALDLARAV